ncbi:DUF6113 family protein [Actinomadura atramentaria]|uniref:DUF6113 family protein n=1 Tax=Actinomadura atramentaria TaxID=1990 RepID=UPI00035FCC57|nr:DUF6113 family protein [Actinomadura atramentaria]
MPIEDEPATPPGPAPGPGAPTERSERADAVVTGAAYAVLTLLGAVAGAFGAAVQDWPVAPAVAPALAAVAVLFALLLAAGFGMRSWAGALLPGLAWAAVTLMLSQQRPEGDLLILGNLPGYVYMVGGVLAVCFAPLLILVLCPPGRPSGSWLTAGADRRGPAE